MNTDNTIREKAISWYYNLLTSKQRELHQKYGTPDVIAIYKGEHPTETIKEVASLSTGGGFTGGEWYIEDDIFIRSGNAPVLNTAIANFLSYEENKANAIRIVTCVNNFDDMKTALHNCLTTLETINLLANVSIAETTIKEAKAILDKIDNQ